MIIGRLVLKNFFKNESDGIVIPMSIYRCFILGKSLEVVVSRGQEQAQINAFHNMSFPSHAAVVSATTPGRREDICKYTHYLLNANSSYLIKSSSIAQYYEC